MGQQDDGVIFESEAEETVEHQPEQVEDTPVDPPEDSVDEPTDEGGEAQAATPEEYTPDFNYKVYDEQREIPDYLRPLITNKETEEQIRSLMCKADGLDPLKEKYGKARDERDDLRNQFSQVERNMRELDHFKKKDLGQFFKLAEISDDAVINYVRGVLNRADDPDEAEAYRRHQDQIRDSFQADQRSQDLAAENQRLRFAQHERDMDIMMNSEAVSPFVQRFDQMSGKPGAFVEQVNDYGSRVYQAEQRYVTPMEAAAAVMERYRGFINNTQPVDQPVEGATSQKPEAIPNIGAGRTVSPTQKRPKNLEEMAAQIKAQYG